MKQILTSFGIGALFVTAVGCAADTDTPDVSELPPSVVRQLDPGLETIVIDPRAHRASLPDGVIAQPAARGDETKVKLSPDQYGSDGSQSSPGPVEDKNPSPPFERVGSTDHSITIPADSRPALHSNPGAQSAETTSVGTGAGHPQQPLNPCECQGSECLNQWVQDNVGCGVCVVFTCGNDYYPHSCQTCQ